MVKAASKGSSRKIRVDGLNGEVIMAKTFYTERDIDDMHARGVTGIDITDDIVLTDLARERMFKYGMRANRIESRMASPLDNSQEILVQRIKTAVLARLNGQVDPVLLDKVIRRVIADMK
jgi:hypothetical protein